MVLVLHKSAMSVISWKELKLVIEEQALWLMILEERRIVSMTLKFAVPEPQLREKTWERHYIQRRLQHDKI